MRARRPPQHHPEKRSKHRAARVRKCVRTCQTGAARRLLGGGTPKNSPATAFSAPGKKCVSPFVYRGETHVRIRRNTAFYRGVTHTPRLTSTNRQDETHQTIKTAGSRTDSSHFSAQNSRATCIHLLHFPRVRHLIRIHVSRRSPTTRITPFPSMYEPPSGACNSGP